jgi:hypothetical protein
MGQVPDQMHNPVAQQKFAHQALFLTVRWTVLLAVAPWPHSQGDKIGSE